MGPVSIRFVEGHDDYTEWPTLARDAGLYHRFGVIQDTYVPDQPDMVFDEPLWWALVKFVQAYAPDGELTVSPNHDSKLEESLEQFRDAWTALSPKDRDPPAMLILRRGGRPILCMLTDYWYAVGGPGLYHDSCTYSLFSHEPLSDRIRQHLKDTSSGGRWSLANEVTQVSLARPAALARLQKMFSLEWLRR